MRALFCVSIIISKYIISVVLEYIPWMPSIKSISISFVCDNVLDQCTFTLLMLCIQVYIHMLCMYTIMYVMISIEIV